MPLGCGDGQDGRSAAPAPTVLPPSLEPCDHVLQGMAGAPLAHGGGAQAHERHAARQNGHALGMAALGALQREPRPPHRAAPSRVADLAYRCGRRGHESRQAAVSSAVRRASCLAAKRRAYEGCRGSEAGFASYSCCWQPGAQVAAAPRLGAMDVSVHPISKGRGDLGEARTRQAEGEQSKHESTALCEPHVVLVRR